MSIGEEYMALRKKKIQDAEARKKQERQEAYENSSDVGKEYMRIRASKQKQEYDSLMKSPAGTSMDLGARAPFDVINNPIAEQLKKNFDAWKKDNSDEYLAYVDRQNKLNYDLGAGQKKIDDLNRAMSLRKDIQAIGHDVPTDITREYDAILRAYGLTGNEDLKELMSAENVMFSEAKRTQEGVRLSSVADSSSDSFDPEFEKLGVYVPTEKKKLIPDYEDIAYELINGNKNVNLASGQAWGKISDAEYTRLLTASEHMNDSERALYNYWYAKGGYEAAEAYLDSIMYDLNTREASGRYGDIEGKTALELLHFIPAGFDQANTGIESLFNTNGEYRPPTATQMVSGAVREDLGNTGPEWVGKTLQTVYDAGTTITNMAPSILTSIAIGTINPAAGAWAGNAIMGGSAAGNAYQEKLNLGYSKEQARSYGLMIGASEIVMEKLLGGISKLGGGMLSNTVLKNLDNVDNILAKVAKSTGGKILMNAGSEALEEGLQSILEPYIWQAVSGEDASVDWQDALYSSLLGFITGGVFEGANAAFETVALNNETKQKYGAAQGEVVTEALEIDPDSNFAQRMQSKLDNGKDLSGSQINKLLKNNEAGLVKNDIASIQKAAEATLVKYGETGDVKVISEALAKQVAGKSLTRAEKTAISESKYGQRVANELNPENIQSGDFNTAWAESIDTDRINAEEYSRLVQDAELEVADTAPEGTAQPDASTVIPLRTGEINEADSTISAEAQEATSAPVASVSIEEVSKKYGAQAKAMVATYNQGQDVAKFDRAYGIAYEMGKSDVGVHYAVNSEATSYLTQAQRELAYVQGSFAGKNGAKSLDAKNKPNGTGNGVRRKGAVKLEGIKASEFRKMLKDSNDPRGKAAKVLMTIAEVTGIDIVLFKSQVDASGRYVGEQGRFEWKDDTIYIDVNAGLLEAVDTGEYSKYLMLRTFGHEFTHFMEKNAATQYTEFRKLVFAEMTKKGENVDYLVKRKQLQYKDEKLSYEAASREVVADAMGDILRDSKFVENLAQKHNGLFKTLLDQFKRFIRNIRSYFNSIAGNPSPEAKALKEEINGTMKYLDSIVEMFDKVAMEAVENYQQRVTGEDVVSELTPGEEGVVADKDGEPVAYSTEDGTVMLSIRTYEDEGRAEFRKYLEKCVKNKSLTETEMTEMLDGIEEVYNICKEFKDKYAPFSKWSDAEVIRDTRGKPVFSVVTPNGEYKMNLDFSLVCKKRRTLDAVFNEMSKRGIIDDFELGKKTIVKINELIRKYKFETACNLCFVDAKRYRQADVADSVVRLYNDLVQSLVPEEHIGSIERFNFAGYATIKPVADGIHTWPNSKLDFSHINEVLKQYEKDTVEAKAARYIKNNPEARKFLLRGDFMSSGGFDAVKSQNQNIMSLYNSKKGTGGPKAAFGDVQYMNEVIKKARWWTPAKAYDVGGVRIQSFSDYVPRMVFDYVQMIYDLAATKLPAHAYTKEAIFVMQFGLTGVKINMSLIPAVVEGGIAPGLDADGNYAWAGESFDFETAKAIQKAPGYSENCGTIAVGVSYEHILKLLRDPDIRMVIPYHKSGLNPVVAHMNKIAEFTDYTSLKTNPKGCQSTMDAEGNKVEKDFDFNKTLRAVGDPKLAADQYLQWCDDPAHGYTPKFAEFRGEENYYKLLVDFTVYDESGTYVPQREVEAVFPKEGATFGSMKDLIKSGLEEDAIIQGRREALIPEIVDEIEENIARTEAEIPDDEQVEQADHDVEAELMDENRVQKSIRTYDSVEEMDSDYLDAVDSEDVETQKQMVAEAAKRAMPDTVVVDTKGDLMLMYHGTANGGAFTVFEGNKLSNESRTSQIGQGFYFTNSKADAEAYTKNVDIYGRVSKGSNPHLHQVYLNITNPFDVRKDTLDLDKVKSVYMDGGYDYFYDNWIPFYLDKKSVNGKTFTKADLKAMSREDRVSAFVDYYSKFGSKEVLSNMVRAFGSQNQGALLESMKNRLGYDGIVEEYKPGLFQYVAFSSEQIKSADPVTYDDNGNVIPLSERFNEENNDIRYQKRTNTLTDHEILDMAARDLDTSKLTDAEKSALEIFQKRVDKLKALKEERQKQGSIFYEHQFGANKDTAKATAARNRMTVLDKQITKASAEVLGLEDKKVLKDVLQKSRKVIEQKERKESLERIRVAREETSAKERKIANEKLEALRQKKNERIAEVRAEERKHGKEVLDKYKEDRNISEAIRKYQDRIKKDAGDLMDWLMKPDNKTVKKHIPEPLKNVLVPFLSGIDFSSKRSLNGGEDTKKDITFRKRLQQLQRYATEAFSADDYYGQYLDLPPDFLPKLKSLCDSVDDLMERVSDDYILNRMNPNELKSLSDVLRTLKKAITQINTFHNNQMFKHVDDASENTMEFLAPMKPMDKNTAASRFLLWKQMRPAYVFERFGKGGISVYDGFRRGQSTLAFDTKKITEFANKAYTPQEVKAWEDDRRTIKLSDGQSVTMSIAQIMGLYELSKRNQALVHIMGEGIRPSTFKNANADSGHQLTEEDLSNIINHLSARQKEVADSLQQFMEKVGGEWGNQITVARFGEKQFGEPHYYPINSDRWHLNANADEMPGSTSLYALLNMSFTKQTVEGANNRIVVFSIFDVFASHMASMAQYHSFALPVLDALKWFNYKRVSMNVDGSKNVEGSVREELNRVYGVPHEQGKQKSGYAESFILNILKALNGTEAQGSSYDSIGLKALNRTNRSAIAYNLRVVVQQPTAISRAALLLDYSSIMKGLHLSPTKIKSNIQEMLDHSGIALWKSLGFYDINISRNLTSMIKHDSNLVDKIMDVGTWGAETADKLTWSAIWSACKAEVSKKQGIRPGMDGYYEAVTQLFEEVIYKTQVVDSILTKTEFMRDKGFFAKASSSFMSEPITTANAFFDVYDKYLMDRRSGMSRAKAWKKNGKKLGRTAYTFAISTVLLAAIQSIIDGGRDDDEYMTYWEKYKDKFWGNLIDEAMPFNKLPIVNDAYELTKEILSAVGWIDTYGSPPRSIYMQWWDSLVKGVQIISGRVRGDEDRYTWYSGIYKLLTASSQIAGLPISNVTRTVINAWNNIVPHMAPGLRVKTYDAGDKNEIRYAYQDGYLTEEEATHLLIEKGVVADSDEAYWMLREWDTGDSSKYSAVFDAALSGTGFNEALKEMTDHGYEKDDVLSKLKTQIKTWYTDEESETRITKQQAMDMLKKYVGMSSDEVTAIINQWSCKVVTGIAYDDIKGEFLTGNITASRAIDMRVRYGGKTRENAQKEVEGWNFEKKYGFSYSDRVDAFLNGKISSSAMRTALMEYGGMSGTEADDTIKAYEWMKRNPRYDLSVSDVIGYIKPIEGLGYSLEHAGVSPDTYVQYKDLRSNCKGVDANGDGKTDSGSVKAEVLEAIDSLPISDSQKDALYYLNGWAASKIWQAPWH